MVSWRGQLIFKQFIKNKSHKYGVKLYILTELNGVTVQFLIYIWGGGPDAYLAGTSHATKVKLKLMEGKLNVAHKLFMDKFYNSVELATLLRG